MVLLAAALPLLLLLLFSRESLQDRLGRSGGAYYELDVPIVVILVLHFLSHLPSRCLTLVDVFGACFGSFSP